MNYTIIVLGVVVIILLYILYKYFSTSATTLSPLAKLSLTNPALPMPANSTSLNYAYGVWVSVNSWSSGYKTIFRRSGSASIAELTSEPVAPTGSSNTGGTSPQIILYLDKTSPKLSCYIDQQTNTDAIGPIQITPNFPLQTWVYVTISVQSHYIDLYLQGKLVKSIQLKAVPTQPGDSTKQVYLGAEWDGSIAKFQYYPHSLNPQDVWANYMSGNGQNSMAPTFSSYGVNVDLTSNDKIQNTIKLL